MYYFDQEGEGKQPSIMRDLKLGYLNSDADWSGNFAVGFMWTLEPIVILASPLIFKRMIAAGGVVKKEKKD